MRVETDFFDAVRKLNSTLEQVICAAADALVKAKRDGDMKTYRIIQNHLLPIGSFSSDVDERCDELSSEKGDDK